MDLIVETTDPAPHPGFGGPATDLLAFLSFGAVERYGAMHPLSDVAKTLRRRHHVDLRPLFTFGDAAPEDEEDRRALEGLWQDPAPLAASCAAVIDAIRADDRLRDLTVGFPELLPRLADLQRIAEWAATRGARVRLTYRL